MTANRDIDRIITIWLEAEAAPVPPAGRRAQLADALAAQRPLAAWRAPIGSRWPDRVSADSRGRASGLRTVLLAFAAVLALGLVGAAVLIGTRLLHQEPSVRTFHLGSLAYSTAGGVFIGGPGGERPVRIGDGTDPAWSPDGRHLLYQQVDPAHAVLTPSVHTTVVVVEPDGRTIGSFPGWMSAWSPDSSLIATWEGTDAIVVWSPVGRRITRLSGVPRLGDAPPRWSPDGTAIVLSGGEWAEPNRMAWLPIDGSATRLIDVPGYGAQVASDGIHVASARRSAGSGLGALLLSTVDDPNRTITLRPSELVADGTDVTAPVWSPSGDRVAFVLLRIAGPPSEGTPARVALGDAWVYDLATGRSTRLAGDGGVWWPVRWAPDGGQVLLEHSVARAASPWTRDRHGIVAAHQPNAFDQTSLWRVGADGTGLTLLTGAQAGDWQWLSDR